MSDLNQSLKSTVLYVDDEENNLNSFRAAFRREFRIYTAINAVDALKLLKKHPEIKVIIADQRMPDITGVEFFEKIRFIYPNKVRIILTGYSDITAVIDAINKGKVYQFIDKPWNNEMISTAVSNATERYDTRKRLRDRSDSLETAYKELDKFVYSVSHDLRSPLMSILGIANLAEIDVEDAKSLEYFKSIKGMVGKLDGYIHEIIHHYKDNHGNDIKDEVDLNEIVKDIIESIKYHPNAQDVKFEIAIDPDTKLKSNLVNIKTVLSNLISNAFKYQRPEEEHKMVKVLANFENNEMVVRVVDNGVGIEKDKLEEVFKMFYRETLDDSGSGLGLYIVRDAVDKLNGKIELKSEIGKGTEVIFRLPINNEK